VRPEGNELREGEEGKKMDKNQIDQDGIGITVCLDSIRVLMGFPY
jgi:hypothetical protein